ncbi:MAG: hypothetical protein AB1611_10190 [bacterium]
MKKVLIIDTSVLCVWLRVPGMESCGPDEDQWDWDRVEKKIDDENQNHSIFVLPLATIIETGNHISRAKHNRRECGVVLADLMSKSADQKSPWAAFSDQAALWTSDKLKELANTWPDLAAQKLSLGDVTIKDVAEYYAQSGYEVEILTGDKGLKAYQPIAKAMVPRRRQKR